MKPLLYTGLLFPLFVAHSLASPLRFLGVRSVIKIPSLAFGKRNM